MTTTTVKVYNKPPRYIVKKDLKAWKALCGVWRDKKIKGVLEWQKEIRKEWERKLPRSKFKINYLHFQLTTLL